MKNVKFNSVKLKNGFWHDRCELNRTSSIYNVYKRFDDTGRIRAFNFDWKEGMPDKPHFFWDSDVAKWIESVAYIVSDKRDEALEALADALIDKIEKYQDECGYFNIFHTVIEPQNRFSNRDHHELYCAGHLMEAAVAYYEATGKRKLLDCMEKYGDYIKKVFVDEDSAGFVTPGHEEIELALVKMYECTGDKKWLELSKFFLDKRGENLKNESTNPWKPDYSQSHIPVREQRTAEGHAVRACYLYTAMADIARLTGDEGMIEACDAIFDNIVNKRMYITGGIGSAAAGEAFTQDYDLPNITAYTESCAAIALAFFARRLQEVHVNSVYADVVERVMYNGFLSSVSLDGKAFFYENPLEIPPRASKLKDARYPITERLEVFGCSCCPPNVTRFTASIAEAMYTVDDKTNTVYVQQYIASDSRFDTENGPCRIVQDTEYPNNGSVKITYYGEKRTLAVRIPAWCDSYRGEKKNGYAYFEVESGDTLEFCFAMRPVFVEANMNVNEDLGRCALTYGPIVMCLEAVDNGSYLRDVRIKADSQYSFGKNEKLGLPTVRFAATRRNIRPSLYMPRTAEREEFTAEFIPYFAFANRGESEMLVFVNVD